MDPHSISTGEQAYHYLTKVFSSEDPDMYEAIAEVGTERIVLDWLFE
jgi:hypothetical protein